MNTHDAPPQSGLTRHDTGHPSVVFPGWFLLPGEVQRQDARSQRRATYNGVVVEDFTERPIRAVSPQTEPNRSRAEIARRDWQRRTGERGRA